MAVAAVAAATQDFDPASYDPTSFDVYAGRYAVTIQPGMVLSFSREGDRLLVQATGQSALEMTPTTDSTFAVAGAASGRDVPQGPGGNGDRTDLAPGRSRL